jgi:hypothetical protein
MYEIKHLDLLTKTLYYPFQQTLFFHTLHGKCSELQRTFHNFLHWFPILIYPLLTYSCNTNEEKHVKKLKIIERLHT